MAVKSVRGRRRYIAFTVDSSLDRGTLIAGLNSLAGGSAPYVIQCSEGWAIIRTSPEGADDAIALMRQADQSSVSLCTSGTLRTLRDRYPRLRETRPPSRRR